MLSRHFYVLTRLAATIAISSSQRYWRSSGNYSCTLWFFRTPATKGCLWQGALSHESSNKKAYYAEGHDIMNVGAMHPLMSRFARSSKRLAIFRNTRKIASLTIFCASCFAVLCHVNNHLTRPSCGFNKICENCEKSQVLRFFALLAIYRCSLSC